MSMPSLDVSPEASPVWKRYMYVLINDTGGVAGVDNRWSPELLCRDDTGRQARSNDLMSLISSNVRAVDTMDEPLVRGRFFIDFQVVSGHDG